MTIEIKAAIDKADIATCAELVGSVNESPCTLDGQKFDARAVAYEGFAGGLDAPKDVITAEVAATLKYKGVHAFRPATVAEQESAPVADFSELPGL